MESWRFLILNWGVRRDSEGFGRGSGGVLRGSDVRSRRRIYRFDSRDNMRHHHHHHHSVRHRPSSCPSDLRLGGLKKIRNHQIPIRNRQPDLILLALPAWPRDLLGFQGVDASSRGMDLSSQRVDFWSRGVDSSFQGMDLSSRGVGLSSQGVDSSSQGMDSSF